MSNADSVHAFKIGLVAKLLPRQLYTSLIEDRVFRERHGINVETEIVFQSNGPKFARSAVFAAGRELFSGIPEIQVSDAAGANWAFSLDGAESNEVRAASNGELVSFSDLWALSPSCEQRLARFDEIAKRDNLSGDLVDKWRPRIGESPLADDDVGALIEELRKSPIPVGRSISNAFGLGGEVGLSVLVPDVAEYYERLVGRDPESGDLATFVASQATRHIDELIKWNPVEGLKLALLMSAHSSITAAIAGNQLDPEVLSEVLGWLCSQGDRFSQVGGIEIGITYLDVQPQLAGRILALVKAVCNDSTAEDAGRPSLTSSLMIFVEGELARTGILRGRPPFWRRLASIAQAALIERQLIAKGLATESFGDWARARAQHFYWQTLIDLRLEPRWLPDFAASDQLKAEFLSRIASAGRLHESNIQEPVLRDLLLGEGQNCIPAMLDVPKCFLPGPLDASISSTVDLPEALRESIKSELEAPVVTERPFTALLNCALIYRIDSELPELAAAALRKAKYYLRGHDEKQRGFALLAGLSMVAAVTESSGLADEVRVLARVIRRGLQADQHRSEDFLRIAMIAAAARREVKEWRSYVGEFATELCFEERASDQSMRILLQLHILCQIDPALWPYCAKAEAACSAFLRPGASQPSAGSGT